MGMVRPGMLCETEALVCDALNFTVTVFYIHYKHYKQGTIKGDKSLPIQKLRHNKSNGFANALESKPSKQISAS